MYTITREFFKRISSIIPSFAVSTTAISKTIDGKNATIQCLSGNLYFNPLTTATSANGLLLTAGTTIDFSALTTISLISDSSGATAQIVIWED